MVAPEVYRSLARQLVDCGLIETSRLVEIEEEAHRTGETVAEVVARTAAVPEPHRPYLEELAHRADYFPLGHAVPDPEALALLPDYVATHYKALPLSLENGCLLMVMATPGDVNSIDYLQSITRRRIQPAYAPAKEIERAITFHYGAQDVKKMGESQDRLAVGGGITPAAAQAAPARAAEEPTEEQPVIEFVDAVLEQAVGQRASDIHIEPHEGALLIRFRVDGLLRDVQTLPLSMEPAVVARIKVMAGMNMAERRLPQDGRHAMRLGDHPVDFRISTVPLMDGEKVVIRVLDRQAVVLDLATLGFETEQLERYLATVNRAYGMVLVTGPTGSGKTATLYATLNRILKPEINVISIEDPVEYRLDRVNQIQVNARIDLTFARVLRAVLRQDPNVILVGEVRDLETAELAVQAALTGHLVLGTLHTNDAPSAMLRLVDMGVPDYMVASTVNGLLAQRLVRRICAECRETYTPPDDERACLPNGAWADGEAPLLYRGRGCDSCNGTGYRGRSGIYEVLPVSTALRQALVKSPSTSALYAQARLEGMKSLREAACTKVLRGETTIQEMLRVTVAEEGA